MKSITISVLMPSACSGQQKAIVILALPFGKYMRPANADSGRPYKDDEG